MNFCKQTFHISHARISEKVKGVLRWLLGLRKLRSSEKFEILQIGLFCEMHNEKTLFSIMDERKSFFPYFYHGTTIYSAELFDCAINNQL